MQRVYSLTLIIGTQNHFAWICPSFIYYRLFRIPAISSNFSFPLRVRNSGFNCICQHCGVKTSMVTPSFYYAFLNISLPSNNSAPRLIRNLWWVLLPGNQMYKKIWVLLAYQGSPTADFHKF